MELQSLGFWLFKGMENNLNELFVFVLPFCRVDA